MKISNTSAIPFTIHQSSTLSKKEELPEKFQKQSEEKVSISVESWQKLKENAEPQESNFDKLPKHIKDMVKAIERLIEQIKIAKAALEKAKAQEYPDNETKHAVLSMHHSQVNSLELARFDAIQALQEAMKEAGIYDPSITANLSR